LLTSALFFPYDDDHFTQLYNFALGAIDGLSRHGDTYISDIAFVPAVSSVFQTLGLDFTGNTLAAFGIKAANRFTDMYAELCANCTMITITKLGMRPFAIYPPTPCCGY
jgi:hypothetical protein